MVSQHILFIGAAFISDARMSPCEVEATEGVIGGVAEEPGLRSKYLNIASEEEKMSKIPEIKVKP